jgi:hypothetical protein
MDGEFEETKEPAKKEPKKVIDDEWDTEKLALAGTDK